MQFKVTWPQIILLILCVAMSVLLTNLFTTARIKSEASQRHIETLQNQIETERSARLQVQRIADSVILENVTAATQTITKARSNATYYQSVPKRLQEINTTVATLNDSALRRAFAEF